MIEQQIQRDSQLLGTDDECRVPHAPSADEGRTQSRVERRLLPPREAGMTLVEIMIVLTIMAGIMAFAAYSVVGYLKSSKVTDATAEVEQIRGFIETYRVMHNSLPDQLSDLEEEVGGMGRITDRMPNDPWDNAYNYSNNNDSTYELFSSGADGQSGSEDDIWPEGMRE